MPTNFNIWTPKGNVIPNVGGSIFANPNVIFEGNAKILSGTVFKMWCSCNLGFTNPGIYYFESTDGISWTAYGSNPIIANYELPKVFKVGSTYYLYVTKNVEYGLGIYGFTSTDGLAWTARGIVIPISATGWDNQNVFQLSLCDIISGTWYAYYTGTSYGAPPTDFYMGLATSSDGLVWTKSPNNPIIRTVTSNFTFQKINDIYYGWSQGFYNNAQMVASSVVAIFRFSSNSVTGPWTELTYLGNPVSTFYPAIPADFQESNSNIAIGAQVGDPSIIQANGNCYIYYSITRNGSALGLNGAIATGTTLAQLVSGYEGVVGAPISSAPQLNLVTSSSDSGVGIDSNPIGGNWTQLSTTAPYGPSQRLSNLIKGQTATSFGDSYWNPISWANDQWAQVTIDTVAPGGSIGPQLRMNVSGTPSMYRLQAGNAALGAISTVLIRRVVNDVNTALLTITGLIVNRGDTLLAVANGSAILLYWNGFIIGAATDSTLASGSAGFLMFNNGVVANAAIGAWSGGTFKNAPSLLSVPPLGTTPGTILGVFNGANLKAAFSNPNNLDLIQVINEGNQIVWSLSASGVVSVNPLNPTPYASWGRYLGQSFATAFPTLVGSNLFQVVSSGNAVVFYVDKAGNAGP